MKFFYVYVLRSLVKDWIYVGYSENIKQRLLEHNSGKTPSTSRYKPYELIHYEAYRNMKDAKRRELYLKTTKGKTTLRTMIKEYLTSNKLSY
jgi:putative endonuclease